jgi:hypothetical protein
MYELDVVFLAAFSNPSLLASDHDHDVVLCHDGGDFRSLVDERSEVVFQGCLEFLPAADAAEPGEFRRSKDIELDVVADVGDRARIVRARNRRQLRFDAGQVLGRTGADQRLFLPRFLEWPRSARNFWPWRTC